MSFPSERSCTTSSISHRTRITLVCTLAWKLLNISQIAYRDTRRARVRFIQYSQPIPYDLIAEIALWCYESGDHGWLSASSGSGSESSSESEASLRSRLVVMHVRQPARRMTADSSSEEVQLTLVLHIFLSWRCAGEADYRELVGLFNTSTRFVH